MYIMRLRKEFLFVMVLSALFFAACDDDFLDRGPLTEITPDKFFKTERDLQIYVNGFYNFSRHGGGAGRFGSDDNTDNQLPGYYGSRSHNTRWNGETTVPSSGGGYSWGNIRGVNYFFSALGDIKNSSDANIRQYIGEAYFFRAWEYFKLLKQFGDLPWIDKPLKADINETALSRISRKTIVENMVKDLDKAIDMMKDGNAGEYSRVNKHIALAFKARVCLYEGTWEKYHSGSAFGVSGSDGSDFIRLARDAAKAIIDYGEYDLHADDGKKIKDYARFFAQTDYGSNKEILFWAKMDLDKGLFHSIPRYLTLGEGPQVTQEFVDDCLMMNGKAITESDSGYPGQGKGSYQVNLLDEGGKEVKDSSGNNLKVTRDSVLYNRDPRLVQNVFAMGDLTRIDMRGAPDFVLQTPLRGDYGIKQYTGYKLRKGANPKDDQYQSERGTQGTIIFRYAEVLLIYAEAQAELGNDAEAVAQIDKLRERVGMPKLSAVRPAGSNTLKEVRRERRVELLAEGFRQDDIFRWKAAGMYITGKRPHGIKYKGNAWLEALYTGNFKPIVDVSGARNPTALPKSKAPEDDELENSGAFDGHVSPYRQDLPSGYQFNEGRDYLRPINTQDITLSKGKLKQNPGYTN